MLLLFTLLLFVALDAYDLSDLNDFTADVDIYDMGTIGRGKNACIWNRSTKDKQEVFYYLAMQPWRHLVWTDCSGTECYKYFINEDASSIPALNTDKLEIKPENDYCRKEYANPLATFDIDWTQIGEHDVLESTDINGNTCYRYPAKQPLAYIYLTTHYTKSKDLMAPQPCRYDFIGGKSITFRSFNSFSDVFITSSQPNGYLNNKTRCKIDPTPNNVDTDLALVLGIADTNVVQTINEGLSKLGQLTTVKQVKVYYISGDSLKRETVALKDLASLKTKQISAGPVDALINTAKNELVQRVNAKEIKRGTIIALMDRTLTSTFDAETAFDRNNITVHTILYNPKGDNLMRIRARALLSVGEHYHEFSQPTGISTVLNDLFIGVRTNLTERCNRDTCNGFCDARDRCTCPMCCENTCFFTYCNTTTATCMPWPEVNPKKKIECKNDCVGTQECIDLQGCVYTEYNQGCAPRAKCMRPYCENNKCKQESSCEADKKPSYQNRCWNYTCNEKNGNCERNTNEYGNECPRLTDLCHELVCEPITLKCEEQKKNCVKTAQYADMDCYKAECNKKTGQCQNVLNCGDALQAYSGCGKTEGLSLSKCECNAASGFKCSCKDKTVNTNGFCKADEICDSSDESKEPFCRKSECNQDLYIEGCEIKTCNENTGVIEWVEYDCSKNVTIKNGGVVTTSKDVENSYDNVEKYCMDKFEIICDKGECYGQKKDGIELKAGCGECKFSEAVLSADGYHKTYTVTYQADCGYLKVTCPDGREIEKAKGWYKDEKIGECLPEDPNKPDDNLECRYNSFKEGFTVDAFDMCQECFTSASCYKATEFREYTFDVETGQCDMFVINEENIPGCSECNNEQTEFVSTCTGNEPKTFVYELNGVTYEFDYKIPYVCGPGNQCIPDPEFDCADTELNPDIAGIFELFRPCANNDGIQIDYHYSTKFDFDRYYKHRSQSQEFIDEAVAKAYCDYDFKMDPCKYCNAIKNESEDLGGHLTQGDTCDDTKAEVEASGMPLDSFEFKCNELTNTCEKTPVSGNCSHIECSYYYWDNTVHGDDKCVKSDMNTCTELYKMEQDKLNAFIPVKEELIKNNTVFESLKNIEDLYKVCNHEVKCQPKLEGERDQLNCTYHEDSQPCINSYNDYNLNNKDFGCRIPEVDCDYDTLHCTFRELKDPANDTRFFQERDNVVFGDNCYNYTCSEYVNATTGEIEHHWVLTESSVKELSMQPETICDSVHCDAETGKSVSERRQCNPITDFGLSERMAQCFQCACSLQTGDNVLTMRPDTETATYELDACGNCVVRDRATGNQINEVIECILAQPVNLTGAIAGATVAASVVFGLIGSMVVVSIGALQTYQLVSSAMKNVISTTLENPEFVAADNEATNVLNNGD